MTPAGSRATTSDDDAGSVRVAVGLGANLGDRLAALQGAVTGLQQTPGCLVAAVSDVYESRPVGGPPQPDYLNAVAVLDTTLPAGELLAAAHRIEAAWQRRRTVRWGPRSLDIDILSYGSMQLDSDSLTLPHPRAMHRWFVMLPWAQVDGSFPIPAGDGNAITVAAAVRALRELGEPAESECVRRLDLSLNIPAANTLRS